MDATATPVGLITGASRGLGLALARALASRAWSLIITARDPGALEEARIELAQEAPIVALAGDVADDEHVEELAAIVLNGGRLDLLVNNAATLGPTPRPDLRDYPINGLAHLYSVNALGPLRLTQLMLPALHAANGCVINVVSNAGVEAFPGWGGYGSSKAALDLLTRVLAVEEPGLRVYAADPGDMRTRMEEDAFPGEDISDKPPPDVSVPGLLELIYGSYPSGRYRVRELTAAIT